jgi:DNA-directed RNA polymerase alpha subunit
MKLYHGTVSPDVEQPDLAKCRQKTDFGKGFYTTTSLEQAKKWALLKKKRFGTPHAYVSEYEIDDTVLNSAEYIVRHFSGATKVWLEFVVSNRKGYATHSYDFVMGPVANDSLYATLLLYEQGVLTAEATIEQLKTHTLFDQLAFCSEKAMQTIRFVETTEVG